MTMANWRDIEGYKGYYKVSDNGEVMSIDRTVPHGRGPRILKAKKLKPYVSETYPYKMVNLWKNKKILHIAVHRLVALTFIDNPNNLECVNHIDGNKMNNHHSNLEWCTRGENIQHAFKTGLMDRGSERAHSKLKEEDIPVIRSLYNDVWLRLFQIAFVYDVSRMAIKKVLTGKTWAHI